MLSLKNSLLKIYFKSPKTYIDIGSLPLLGTEAFFKICWAQKLF